MLFLSQSALLMLVAFQIALAKQWFSGYKPPDTDRAADHKARFSR